MAFYSQGGQNPEGRRRMAALRAELARQELVGRIRVDWLGGPLDGCTARWDEPLSPWWWGPDPNTINDEFKCDLLWYKLERPEGRTPVYRFAPDPHAT